MERRNNTKLKYPLIFLTIYLFVSGIILGFSSGGFLVNFKELGFTIVSSVQKGFYTVTTNISTFFTAVSDLSTLHKDYLELQDKLKDYEYMQRTNADILQENRRLKEQLGFSESFVYASYNAQIIGRDPNALYSGITVNKGSKHGIKKGMPVLAIQNGESGLVGKIISVGYETSVIMPVYDYQCNVSARIKNTRDIGIVSGLGSANNELLMKYIKKSVMDELKFGDVIVTSGENDNYLKDIPIGTITSIQVLDYDTSLEISLTPVVNFSRLENVVIIDMKSKNGKIE